MRSFLLLLLACLFSLVLTSCGGGGGGGGNGGDPVTAQVQFTILWGARSRAINGPGSADSIKLEIANAGVPSGDFSFTANRNNDPAAHSETYTSTPQAKTGSRLVSATFYAGEDGTGDVVGVASGQMTIQPNGLLTGTISTVGTIATVEIPAGQTVATEQTKQLAFTCRDANSTIIAVSPGSAIWNVTAGADKLSFSQGYANGLLAGNATVTATVDGKTSAATQITVQALDFIAFVSYRDGNSEIYTMRSDGTDQTRLTNNTMQDDTPVWTPDGNNILFSSERDINREIYIMNADGTGPINLTNHPKRDYLSSVSPDGTKIAFTSDRDTSNQNLQVYVMNIDGTGVVRLTNSENANDVSAVWSPDGSKIAFVRFIGGQTDVFVMDSDGTDQLNLTNTSGDDNYPSFSVDSSKVLCRSARPPEGDGEAWLINTDGTDGFNVTNNTTDDHFPTFNPANSKIAISKNVGLFEDILDLNTDGTGLRNLTNHPSEDRYFIYSLDGSKIVFGTNRDGNEELYIMNSDGTNQLRLTNGSALDAQPAWRP